MLLSELEAGFASRIGERADASVVAEARAVEDDLPDAGGLRALGDEPAYLPRLVALRLLGSAEVLLDRRRGGKRLAGRVVDDLRVDVVEAAEDGQPRPRHGSLQVEADPGVALLPRSAATCDLAHDSMVTSALTSCRRSCRPCRPCGGCARRRT